MPVSISEGEPVHEGLFTSAGLIGGHCTNCGKRHFPGAASCPWCGSEDVSEVGLSAEGTLWAWTAVHAAPPGYDGDVPYGFGVVSLDVDELHVVTRLTESDPSLLHGGMPVRFTIASIGGGKTTWAFEPA